MAWTDVPSFAAAAQASADWNTYLRDNLKAQGEFAKCLFIDPTIDSDASQGSWTVVTDVAAPNDPYGYGLSHGTNGNWIRFYEYLTAGTWTMNIHTAKRNDYGVLGVYIRNIALDEEIDAGEFNLYTNNAVAQFQMAEAISFEVPASERKVIELKIEGKDPQSSGSTVRIFGIVLQKTADLQPYVWTAPRTWAGAPEFVSAAALATHLEHNLKASGPFRRRYYIDPFTWAGTSGGTLVSDARYPLGHYAYLDTQNEYVEWDVVLPAGDVDVTGVGVNSPAEGKIHVLWDGVDQGNVDYYLAGAAMNVRKTVSFTVTTPKKAKLQLKVASKNASSSGYLAHIARVAIGYDDTGWTNPKHLPARVLTSVADLNTNC